LRQRQPSKGSFFLKKPLLGPGTLTVANVGMSATNWASITQLDAVTATLNDVLAEVTALKSTVATNAADANAAWLILCGVSLFRLPR
jgi:hypothetical protein